MWAIISQFLTGGGTILCPLDFDKLIWFQMLTTQTNHELE